MRPTTVINSLLAFIWTITIVMGVLAAVWSSFLWISCGCCLVQALMVTGFELSERRRRW